MRDKEAASILQTQQESISLDREPIPPDAQCIVTAERELAAFYSAVLNMYGLEEAQKAAEDWMEALTMMDWSAEASPSCWRLVTKSAIARLASRITGHPASS